MELTHILGIRNRLMIYVGYIIRKKEWANVKQSDHVENKMGISKNLVG